MNTQQTATTPRWFFRVMAAFTVLQLGWGTPYTAYIVLNRIDLAVVGGLPVKLFGLFVIFPIAIGIAILVLRRTQGNVTGLLLLLWSNLILTFYVGSSGQLGTINAIFNISWIGLWMLPVYFPDGRAFPNRLAQPIMLIHILVILVEALWGFAQPTHPLIEVSTKLIIQGTNPLYVPILGAVRGFFDGAEFILLCLSAVSILTLILKYRRGNLRIKNQIKWLMLVVIALVAMAVVLWPILTNAFAYGTVVFVVFTGFIYLAPFVAVANAILRHRLYDIDIIIRRTLIYAALTTILAAVYFGSIVLAQQLFRAATGQQSDLAIVIATLTIAALFTPLRRRIQNVIDRRLYRRKYDAEQVLAAFSATLRNDVDLDQLRASLIGVVHETMLPTHVSLWLKEPSRPRTGEDAK